MFDNSIYFAEQADKKSKVLNVNNLHPGEFVLVTIHRDYNTDNPERLRSIFGSFLEIAASYGIDFIIPLHPRTSKAIQQHFPADFYDQIIKNPKIKIVDPVSYLDMILLEKNAQLVMTDSGGVQKEAFFFKRPCLILRSETEWVELIDAGNSLVVDADTDKILEGYNLYASGKIRSRFSSMYGDGNASKIICDQIIKLFD